MNLDQKRGVILVHLDLSAAFDTTDHATLFHQLQYWLGLSINALDWFKSYLSDRTQSVTLDGACSKPTTHLQYGVPQESVLGPLLYIIFTLPLGDILREAGMLYHLYADDTELYLSFGFDKSSSQIECLNILQICISKIKKWMTTNKLKLNDWSYNYHINILPEISSIKKFTIDNIEIELSPWARNIGINFDNNMTMKDHITKICKTTYYHLINIGRIIKCNTQEACEKLMHVLITSRLDNGKATFFGLPDNQINRLQRRLNIAARIIMLTSPINHVTPILKELQFGSQSRSELSTKLSFSPLKHYTDLHLSILPIFSSPNQHPDHYEPLMQIFWKFLEHGQKPLVPAFSCTSPILLNTFPDNVRNVSTSRAFKKQLKTTFFKDIYG